MTPGAGHRAGVRVRIESRSGAERGERRLVNARAPHARSSLTIYEGASTPGGRATRVAWCIFARGINMT